MRKLTQIYRTILLTLLSMLPPDDRLIDDPPFRVAWDPARAHHCIFCLWTVLQYDGATWHCPQCSAQFQSLADTDPLADALAVTLPRQKAIVPPVPIVEKSPIGELSRKVHLGKIALHGVDGAWLQELQWADTGERVNTSELPAIGSWRYTQGE